MLLNKGKLTKINERQNGAIYSAKECAMLAVFVTFTIVAQLCLSFVPGVEIVTVLFVSYAFTMGVKRGVISAFAFVLLRQIIFGFYPTVLILYAVYYPLLAVVFGLLGHKIKNPVKFLGVIVIFSCLMTVVFTLIDDTITPLWLGFGLQDARLYFLSSLPFMVVQVISSAVSVFCLFYPLHKVFKALKTKLIN